jgi:hypothetical protein
MAYFAYPLPANWIPIPKPPSWAQAIAIATVGRYGRRNWAIFPRPQGPR